MLVEAPADKAFLPAPMVWERYGISFMTLHRWIRDERINFPQPLYIRRLRYFRLTDLEKWERRMTRASKREAA